MPDAVVNVSLQVHDDLIVEGHVKCTVASAMPMVVVTLCTGGGEFLKHMVLLQRWPMVHGMTTRWEILGMRRDALLAFRLLPGNYTLIAQAWSQTGLLLDEKAHIFNVT